MSKMVIFRVILTPLFCQKRHLTFDPEDHDLLPSSWNLTFVMSQRSFVPNLVTIGQEGHELWCWTVGRTDVRTDGQTDRQKKSYHKAAYAT
jgi:hypothetical protein